MYNQRWTLLVSHRSGQHGNPAFNNEIGYDGEHRHGCERNAQTPGNPQLDDPPRLRVGTYSTP